MPKINLGHEAIQQMKAQKSGRQTLAEENDNQKKCFENFQRMIFLKISVEEKL